MASPLFRIFPFDRQMHDESMINKAKEQMENQAIIAKVPYKIVNRSELETILQQESALVSANVEYLLDYPTVYVVNQKKAYSYHDSQGEERESQPHYVVYVGETNDIVNRTRQHLTADAGVREDWKDFKLGSDGIETEEPPKSQTRPVEEYIIGHDHFNKSLTLDVENKLMHYLLGSGSVSKLNNRRANAQGKYYTSSEFDSIFSDIWLGLHEQDPDLFPAEEIIQDSALFKASPFHKLGDNQIAAEDSILEEIRSMLASQAKGRTKKDTETHRLIFLQGVAGTGKTVLLSHLFYRILHEIQSQPGILDSSEEDDASTIPEKTAGTEPRKLSAYLIVNHNEQVNVYNQIATKLGLQKKKNSVVGKASRFINLMSKKAVKPSTDKLVNRAVQDEEGHAIPNDKDPVDVVLIDEAHLLLMRNGNQGYSGSNQLRDIVSRARMTIAVFDPNQIMQISQQWKDEDKRALWGGGFGDSGDLGAVEDSGDAAATPADDSPTTRKSTESPAEITWKSETTDFEGIEVKVGRIKLEKQYRISASQEIIDWIDAFAAGRGIGPIPQDQGEYTVDESRKRKCLRPAYEVKVFESPLELYSAIVAKETEERRKLNEEKSKVSYNGLSRLTATYDWAYKDAKGNDADPQGFWNVELHKEGQKWEMGLGEERLRETRQEEEELFRMPWNYQLTKGGNSGESDLKDSVWAEKPMSIDEVGSTFTIQGFDLNYAGVIIGPSITYREGKIVVDPEASKNREAKKKDEATLSRENILHELNVLLKRGVHGLYLFAVDPELEQALLQAQRGIVR